MTPLSLSKAGEISAKVPILRCGTESFRSKCLRLSSISLTITGFSPGVYTLEFDCSPDSDLLTSELSRFGVTTLPWKEKGYQ